MPAVTKRDEAPRTSADQALPSEPPTGTSSQDARKGWPQSCGSDTGHSRGVPSGTVSGTPLCELLGVLECAGTAEGAAEARWGASRAPAEGAVLSGEPCGPSGSRSRGRLAEDTSRTGGSAGLIAACVQAERCHVVTSGNAWTWTGMSSLCHNLARGSVLEALGPCFLVSKVRSSGRSAPAAPRLEPHPLFRSFAGRGAVLAAAVPALL